MEETARGAAAPRKIIVIGAGISGAAAARLLLDSPDAARLEVTVLEGRDRTGGRIFTDRAALPRTVGAEVDMGAAWIHGYSRKNPLHKVVSDNGITVRNTELDVEEMKIYRENGTMLNQAEIDRASEEAEKAIVSIWNVPSAERQQLASVEDLLRRVVPPHWMNQSLNQLIVGTYLEFDSGTALSRISAQLYEMDEEFGGGDWMVPGGYSQIVDAVLKGASTSTRITPLLQKDIVEIDYSDSDQVTLRTRDSQVFTADRVIITIPIGVLQTGDVQFKPPLPQDKQASIDRIGIGVVNKLILQFDKVFWPSATLGFAVAPGADASLPPESERRLFRAFVNAKHLVDVPTLVTFAFGDEAERVESMTDEEVTEIALGRLRIMFGANVVNAANVTGIARSKWKTDRFSRGSYVFPAIGNTMQDFDNVAASVNNRLFFAGEHTYWKYYGTVHGAYMSGERAARDAIKSLNMTVPAKGARTLTCTMFVVALAAVAAVVSFLW